jgi:hypothetical protein
MSKKEFKQSGIYIQMSMGFQTVGHILKLEKLLYNLKQSPRNLFLHLKDKLEEVGFGQLECVPYLFVLDIMVCLVYINDMLLYRQKYGGCRQMHQEPMRSRNATRS